MISKEQIEVNVCAAYCNYVQELFPIEIEESKRYLFILQIRLWQLKRRKMKLTHRVEDLHTLRHGFFEAERFFFDFLDEHTTDQVEQEVLEIMQLVAIEFTSEIAEIEAAHPGLRAQFAHDKEALRLHWNHYVTEANELRDYEADAL